MSFEHLFTFRPRTMSLILNATNQSTVSISISSISTVSTTTHSTSFVSASPSYFEQISGNIVSHLVYLITGLLGSIVFYIAKRCFRIIKSRFPTSESEDAYFDATLPHQMPINLNMSTLNRSVAPPNIERHLTSSYTFPVN